MKRTTFYVALLVIIGACLFIVFKAHERRIIQTRDTAQPGELKATNGAVSPSGVTIAPEQMAPKQTTPAVNPARNESTQQKLESLSNAVQNYSAQLHGHIQFYGKVVDENNQAVEGAGVEFVWSHVWPLPEGTPSTNVISDRNGLFSLADVIGSSLGVHVSKSGYYYMRSQNSDEFNFASLPGMTPFQPDPNNPVIFHLRKKGTGADLITSKHGISPYLTIAAPKDGNPIWADLLEGKAGSSGQLEIQSWLEIDPNTHRTKSWRLKLLIPNGGFVVAQDELPFTAPESGYQPELNFPIPDDKGNIRLGVSQNLYYIAFGNPRRYGRLEVNASDQTGEVWFQYAINPDGSRNLEPK
jgi:hypothetical protein